MMTPISPLHPDNLLRLLRELVRFPTVNPPGGEEPAARFVERELRALGCETVVVPYEDGPARPITSSHHHIITSSPSVGWLIRQLTTESHHHIITSSPPARAHVVGRLRGSGER